MIEGRWALAAVFLALATAAACRDSVRPEPLAPVDLSRVEVRGGGQTGEVDAPLGDSIAVRLTTLRGGPASDVTLEWRVLGADGGTTRFPTTRTDAAGRSANVWILGRKSGEQSLEIRAALPEGVAVLDTVRATARPGPVAILAFEGDTSRLVAVGDTTRLVLRATDRFGNPIDPGAAGTRWSSSDTSVAVVDSAGMVRASGLGAATVEARAGSASARVRLRVRAGVESFQVATRSYDYVSAIRERAGRVVAVSTAAYRTAVYSTVWELTGEAWPRGRSLAGARAWLHVTPAGVAYMTVDRPSYHLVSPRPGTWGVDSAGFNAWYQTAAAGSTFFGAVRRGSFGYRPTRAVERWEAGALVDLALPAPYDQYAVDGYLSPPDVALAAASARELYASTSAGTAWWNGQGWSSVSRPDGGGTFKLRLLAAAEDGGGAAAYGVLGTNLLYRFADGRAERVQNPIEQEGRTIDVVAVSDRGEPLLVGNGAVNVRIGGEWREYRIPEGYTVDSAAWGDTGAIWLALARLTGELGYYGPYRDLRFLRLTVRR